MTNAELWTVLHEDRNTIAPVDPPSDRDLIEILAWGIIELRSESEELRSELDRLRSRVDCLVSDEEGIVRR